MIAYHSAMKKYGGVAKSENVKMNEVVSDGRITLLQHDVCSDYIPEVFYLADAIMVFPSWRAGYRHFTENTIAENTNFEQYCSGMARIVKTLGKPSFILTNRTFYQMIKAERYVPIFIERFGSNDMCGVWNYDGDIPKTAFELMKWVGKFGTVLDFSCGYGELSHYVDKCILSDINTGCIKYIRKELMKDGSSSQGD